MVFNGSVHVICTHGSIWHLHEYHKCSKWMIRELFTCNSFASLDVKYVATPINKLRSTRFEHQANQAFLQHCSHQLPNQVTKSVTTSTRFFRILSIEAQKKSSPVARSSQKILKHPGLQRPGAMFIWLVVEPTPLKRISQLG